MVWAAFGVACVAVLLAAYAAVTPGAATSTPAAEPQDRTIQMLAVEFKGTAGEGEKLANGSKVNAYQWEPATLAANAGDRVTLHIYGVNGGVHPASIAGIEGATYSVTDASGATIEEGAGAFNVYRGHWTDVRFVASQPGIYSIVCASHQPTMTGTVHVVR